MPRSQLGPAVDIPQRRRGRLIFRQLHQRGDSRFADAVFVLLRVAGIVRRTAQGAFGFHQLDRCLRQRNEPPSRIGTTRCTLRPVRHASWQACRMRDRPGSSAAGAGLERHLDNDYCAAECQSESAILGDLDNSIDPALGDPDPKGRGPISAGSRRARPRADRELL